MKKFVKMIMILLMVLFTVTVIKIYFTENSINVEIVNLNRQSISDTFLEEGIVRCGNNFDITSNISGNVIEVYLNENDYIVQGDIIAKIDTKDYEYEKMAHENNITSYKAKINETRNSTDIERQTALSNIEDLSKQLETLKIEKQVNEISKEQKSAEISLEINKILTYTPEEKIKMLELEVQLCENNYNLDKNNLENLEVLYGLGYTSNDQINNAKNVLTESEAKIAKAKSQLEESKKELENLRREGKESDELSKLFYKHQSDILDVSINSISYKIENLKYRSNLINSQAIIDYYNSLIENENLLVNQLDEKISNCIIKSNVSGYIIQLPIKSKSIIKTGDLVCEIKIEENYTIDVNVLTKNIPYLNEGQKVKIIQDLNTEDTLYNGVIKEIYNFASETTSALGLAEHRVKVILEVTDKDTNLKDGYNVNVEFELYKQENQLVLPNSALFKDNEEYFVFKVEDKRAILTKVEVKYKANNKTVISDGLKEGDNIVYNANTEGLSDKSLISIVYR